MHILVYNKPLLFYMHGMNIKSHNMFLHRCTNTCHRVWRDLWIEHVKIRCLYTYDCTYY